MKKLLIVLIVCMLTSLLGGVFWYIRNSLPTKPNVVDENINNTSINEIPSGRLLLSDGSTISIPEFIVRNEATTNLASDVFRTIAGDDYSDFMISYLPYNKENSQIEFAVILRTLPLSKTRRDAENILRSRLNLENTSLCKMEVYVYDFGPVTSEYYGQNLGLSFCENALELP